MFLRPSAFSQIREAPGRLLSTSVESQMPWAQDNPYAEGSYFGMAYSDPLHPPTKIKDERNLNLRRERKWGILYPAYQLGEKSPTYSHLFSLVVILSIRLPNKGESKSINNQRFGVT